MTNERVTIEQMIVEGSCSAAWAQHAGYRWDAVVAGGDALAKRGAWLAKQTAKMPTAPMSSERGMN